MSKKPLKNLFSKALVTGASSGIGRAISEMLLHEGVLVWASSRNPSKLPAHPNLHPLHLDLNDPGALRQLTSEIQSGQLQFDLLINNAGAGAFFPFKEFPPQEINNQIQLLFKAPLTLCHAAYPHMLKSHSGTIVNVSSLAAKFPIPYMSLYNSAKAALSQFSQSLILETHQSGVNIIDLQLGDFNTSFNQSTLRKNNLTPHEEKAWESITHHAAKAPQPSLAAKKLRKLLLNSNSGTYHIGSFSQAHFLPFLTRFLPQKIIRYFLRKYYNL